MKVKNVIRGLLREYALEEINIITPNRVVFSGRYDQWKIKITKQKKMLIIKAY